MKTDNKTEFQRKILVLGLMLEISYRSAWQQPN
jgi:hypothetical protein